jgi:aspartate aminotransferase-like enzyme
MRGYEEGKPVYFATPPIQLICALHTSLKHITSRPIEECWAQHKKASTDLKQFVTNELGLKQVNLIRSTYIILIDISFRFQLIHQMLLMV